MLPAIGYTNADQSHFTSRHYWEVGNTDPRLQTGWLGRYLDHVGSADNPLQGVSLDGDLSPSLATAKKPVAALSGPGDYSFWAPGVWGKVEERMLDAIGALGSARGHDPALRTAREVTFQSHRLRQQLAPFERRLHSARSRIPTPTAASPSSSPASPRCSARACRSTASRSARTACTTRIPTRPQTLADDLDLASKTLLAFQRDLEARGLADRVLTLVWSEFGRRAEENGSDGTDHGAAGHRAPDGHARARDR